MTEFSKMNLDNLPKPSNKRGNAIKLSVITIIIVIITGSVLYWLSRDEDTKKEIATVVKDNIDNAIKDTPLEEVASYLEPPPPPKPAMQNQVIMSTTQGEDNSDITPEVLSPDTNAVTIAPKVEEDSRVPMAFVEDAAQWMVSRYTPSEGLNFGIAATNYRYGQTMRGLMPQGEQDVISARAALLRYAFHPTMLKALYNLYADRFVAALGDAAEFPNKGKALTPNQISSMYKAYAAQFQSIGGLLHGIAATPNFLDLVQDIEDLGQESVDIHSKITDAVFDLDTAREARDDTAINAAQLRIDGLNAQYQRVLGERAQANLTLVNTLHNKAPAARGIDADTVIFVAEWFERRQAQQGDVVQSISTIAELLDDLSARLNTAANN